MAITPEESRVLSIIKEGVPGMYKPEQYVVAGTGSRSLQVASMQDKLVAQALVDDELVRLKETHGGNLVIMSGMAEGFDKLLALRALHQGIKLWCAIPNHGYGSYYWGKNSLTGKNMKPAFDEIVACATKVTYVFEDEYGVFSGLYINGRHSNFIRNDFMVDEANEFLVWDPSSKGTADCFKSIIKAKKPYKVLTK